MASPSPPLIFGKVRAEGGGHMAHLSVKGKGKRTEDPQCDICHKWDRIAGEIWKAWLSAALHSKRKAGTADWAEHGGRLDLSHSQVSLLSLHLQENKTKICTGVATGQCAQPKLCCSWGRAVQWTPLEAHDGTIWITCPVLEHSGIARDQILILQGKKWKDLLASWFTTESGAGTRPPSPRPITHLILCWGWKTVKWLSFQLSAVSKTPLSP